LHSRAYLFLRLCQLPDIAPGAICGNIGMPSKQRVMPHLCGNTNKGGDEQSMEMGIRRVIATFRLDLAFQYDGMNF
jgi:hypothetical protein